MMKRQMLYRGAGMRYCVSGSVWRRCMLGAIFWAHHPFMIHSACILIKFYPCPNSVHSNVDGFVDNPIESP
ncbi:MAG: hypothetical protein KAR37_06230 [Alphaproteobacteria bacterium]|nr:hypothetical protein [Alphaproteobacteria bacterium]